MSTDERIPVVVAEIGCNHKGEMDIAKELIKLAKNCNADYAKFQKRNPKELLTSNQYDSPHPNPHNSYGSTYGEHREQLEFTKEQHQELMAYCLETGIGYTTSVWDITSAQELLELNPDYLKVPSACNNNFEMLELLKTDYSGDIHISLGMTTSKEEENLMQLLEPEASRVVLYACTSGYPVPFEDVHLPEISRLATAYGEKVKTIGFSGHHLGIAIDNAAFALGATWVERHFTKDRTWKGTDHAASLEPPGLSKLVRDLHATAKALTAQTAEILEIEKPQREKLKYRKQ